MVKKKETPQESVTQLPQWGVGDKVLWNGLSLTIYNIDERGHIYAKSLTQMVVTDNPFEFTRA